MVLDPFNQLMILLVALGLFVCVMLVARPHRFGVLTSIEIATYIINYIVVFLLAIVFSSKVPSMRVDSAGHTAVTVILILMYSL